MTDFPQAFTSVVTPFDCTNSPLGLLGLKERISPQSLSEDMLKTAKKSKNAQILNVKKIKEIIGSLDVKNPFHLIFESDESPAFDSQFKEFLCFMQESDKNAISVLYELSHNLKLEINVQVEPKVLGTKSIRFFKNYIFLY